MIQNGQMRLFLPMDLDEKLAHINAEKALLQNQVKELDELIEVREEELDLLRDKARKAIEMKSELDVALNDILYLQESMQQERSAMIYPDAVKNLEKELLETLRENHSSQEELKKKHVVESQLKFTEEELESAMNYYAKYQEANEKIISLTSDLELAMIEIDDLKIKLELMNNRRIEDIREENNENT